MHCPPYQLQLCRPPGSSATPPVLRAINHCCYLLKARQGWETLNSEWQLSRGLGAVALKLKAFMDQRPTQSFLTSDFCRYVYPGQEVQKKHRVSVLRALRTLVKGEMAPTSGISPFDTRSG